MLGRVATAWAIHLGAQAHGHKVAESLERRYGLLSERDGGFISESGEASFKRWGKQLIDETAGRTRRMSLERRSAWKVDRRLPEVADTLPDVAQGCEYPADGRGLGARYAGLLQQVMADSAEAEGQLEAFGSLAWALLDALCPATDNPTGDLAADGGATFVITTPDTIGIRPRSREERTAATAAGAGHRSTD